MNDSHAPTASFLAPLNHRLSPTCTVEQAFQGVRDRPGIHAAQLLPHSKIQMIGS